MCSHRGEQCQREPGSLVDPLLLPCEPGRFDQLPDARGLELVGALGPDRLARLEAEAEARLLDPDVLRDAVPSHTAR